MGGGRARGSRAVRAPSSPAGQERTEPGAVAAASVKVRVQPRARRDEIVGLRNGVVVVRVAAPPLEGRANEALRRLLASRLGVPPSMVSVVRGQRSRDKLVQIDGLEQADVDATLATLVPPGGA